MTKISSIERDSISVSPSTIARKWRNIGYRIRWRIANLIAAEHGKKRLRPWTRERLEDEIMWDLRILAEEKQEHGKDRDYFEEILRGVSRQTKLWRKRKENGEMSINNRAIEYILSLWSSKSELKFIEEFLGEMIGIRRRYIEDIIIRSSRSHL